MVANTLNTISYFFKDFTEKNEYSDKSFDPRKYVKNHPMTISDLVTHLEAFNSKKPENSNIGFKNVDKYLDHNFAEVSNHTCVVLTKIKFRQFPKMNGRAQIEFLNKEHSNWTMKENLKMSEFAEDIIPEILKSGVRNVPHLGLITSQHKTGLWGNLFYLRPTMKPGITLDEQYEEAEWLTKPKNYENAIDQIHKILTQDREGVKRLASYLAGESAKNFSNFIRNILKPEIGSLLKTVKLSNLKRDDFKPFKVDRGFRIVVADLKDIEYGDHVYSCSAKFLENKEKIKNLKTQFYLKNRNSIFMDSTLKKTREELDDYPDHYRLFLDEINALQGILNNEVGEANQDAAERLRENREASTTSHSSKKKAEDNPEENRPQPQKKFLMRKQTILSFKTRSTTQLTINERYEKVFNIVTTDHLRSGSAILRKLRYRHPSLETPYATCIRKPLYSMYAPHIFYNNSYPKFTRFIERRYAGDSSTNFDQPAEGSIPENYKCLYIKRLKKVVLRANTLSARIVGLHNMLAHQKVFCKDEVIEFDKPEQRDVYFNRLFELVSVFDKKSETVRFFNADNNTLPARSLKSYYHCLLDYTNRSKGIVKSNFLANDLYGFAESTWHIFGNDGDHITEVCRDLMVQKVMRKGQRSRLE